MLPRDIAANALGEITDRGLHGTGSRVPKGFSRGIDVLGDVLVDRMGTSIGAYFRRHGRMPDLINPETFTEKQLLFKFFGLIPDVSPSDKLAAARYLPEDVRHLISVPRRDFISKLPRLPADDQIASGTYYLKSNHSSGTNCRVRFPMTAPKRARNLYRAQKWLYEIDHVPRLALWWYDRIDRRVYLEEDLRVGSKDSAYWKFFVMNGRVELFQVDTDRSGDHVQTVYEPDGRFIDKDLYFPSGTPVEMPDCLADMVRVAEAIGRNFDFIRVDMFVLNDRPVLGEIALVPQGATIAIRSKDLDHRLGAAWSAPWFGDGVDARFADGHYARVRTWGWRDRGFDTTDKEGRVAA